VSERPAGYPYGEFNAGEWAAEFMRLFPDSDEELMIGWFANAIMTGYDTAGQLVQGWTDALARACEGAPCGRRRAHRKR
jgi:hypothetical protein